MSDFDKEDFVGAVYQMVKTVPYGRATSYGAIARAIGYPNMSRMVGRVLGGCSEVGVPAYRVVNSQGILSGKDAFGTPTAMQEKLEEEGIRVENNRIKDWKKVFWNPLDEISFVPVSYTHLTLPTIA